MIHEIGDLIPVFLDGHWEMAVVFYKHPDKVLICEEKWLNAYKVLFRGSPRWIHDGDIYNASKVIKEMKNLAQTDI